MTEDQGPDIEEMFVQLASGVTSTPDKLTLMGVNPSTLYFSDRPERVVGHLTLEQFVDDWGLGPNSFESDPPNAVLTLPGQTAVSMTSSLELQLAPARRGQAELFHRRARRHAPRGGRRVQPLHRPDGPAAVSGVGLRRAPPRGTTHAAADGLIPDRRHPPSTIHPSTIQQPVTALLTSRWPRQERVMFAYDYPLFGVFWSLFMFTLFVLWIFIVIWVFIDNFRRPDHSGWPRRCGSSSSCSSR